jgi:protein-S-isoprenylcysteine O-methyltransferase Ste14
MDRDNGRVAVDPGIAVGVRSDRVSIVAMLLRTALEDRTLQAELPGYTDSASPVRYRLVPGIW